MSHEVDRMTDCGDGIRNSTYSVSRMVQLGPPFGGSWGLRGSSIVPFERAMAVSYRLSIVTIALSLTIWPQFAIECRRRSNQQGSLWVKILECFFWSRSMMLGSVEREHTMLTNRENFFLRNSNLCDHDTRPQRHGQTTCSSRFNRFCYDL